MKYTIQNSLGYLADEDDNRILFDTKEEALVKLKQLVVEAYVRGYLNPNEVQQVDGWEAWKLFKEGAKVYTKVWGLDWQECTKDRWSLDDFICGVFNFYILKGS